MKIKQILGASQPMRDAGTLYLDTKVVATLQQVSPNEWKVFCHELRLDLQSRVVGAPDDRTLIKLQAKLEYVNELEKLFEGITSAAM